MTVKASAGFFLHPKGISSLSLRLRSRHIARVRFWPGADAQLCRCWTSVVDDSGLSIRSGSACTVGPVNILCRRL